MTNERNTFSYFDEACEYLPPEMPEFDLGDDAPFIVEVSPVYAVAHSYLELLLQEYINGVDYLPTLDQFFSTLVQPPSEEMKKSVQDILQLMVLSIAPMVGLNVGVTKNEESH